jgi:hypothetical protein
MENKPKKKKKSSYQRKKERDRKKKLEGQAAKDQHTLISPPNEEEEGQEEQEEMEEEGISTPLGAVSDIPKDSGAIEAQLVPSGAKPEEIPSLPDEVTTQTILQVADTQVADSLQINHELIESQQVDSELNKLEKLLSKSPF